MAKLSGQTVHTKKEMEELGYTYGEWSSNISPEVQQALDAIAEKSRNLQLTIDTVNFDGIISKEDITVVKSKTDEWCNDIIETINGNKTGVNTAVENLFANDGIVTEQEQKVIDILNKSNDEKKKIVQDANAKITEIIARANKEQRELSEAELKVIQGETIKANKAVLDSMNLSYEERLSAQNLFFEKANGHSAEALSQSLIEERKAMEEQKAIVREKYDAGIQALQASIPTLQGIEKQLAEDELKAKIEQRDKLLKNEQNKWNDIIGTCDEKYPEYMELINKYTGEEMSRADIRRKTEFEKTIAKYDEINKITADGMYKVFNTETKTWDNIVVKVDQATGDIIAMDRVHVSERGMGRDKVVGYSKDICNQMDEEVQNTIKNRSIMTAIMNGYTKATVDSNGNIVGSNGKVIASLENVKTATDGTKEGFININGTPVKIKTNADGVISNLEELKKAIDNIPTSKTIEITYKEQRWNAGASDGVDRGYAIGGTINKSGSAIVNENGVELIDSISSNAYTLSRSLVGESIYAPSNTKVTNALMTTAKMERMVEKEVSNAFDKRLNKLGDAIEEMAKNIKNNDSKNNNTYHVNANFPNATSTSEIEKALLGLSQKAEQESTRRR